MKKFLCSIIAIALLNNIPLLASTFTGRVVGVSDGDTISVMHGKKAEKIRFYGIDCPEKKQDFGSRAKQFTSEACFGKNVTIESKVKDRYGRTIGIVILPNGKNLNQELIKIGYAWWYKQYSAKDKSLQTLEIQAKKAKRGLWSQPNPIPPWEFRKKK